MRKLVPFGPVLALPLAVAAAAQPARDAVPLYEVVQPPPVRSEPMRYGPDGRTLDLTVPRTGRGAPIIVRLAGGDFARDATNYSTLWLPHLFDQNGYAFATIWIPRRDAEDAEAIARDNAAAIAQIVREIDRERVDVERIVLMGEGPGGHFAALLGTDPRHLEQAGVPFESVRGVFIVNGDGFDIPGRIATSDRHRARQYERVFGTDRAAQAALSPVSHLALPNSPAFLFHVVRGAPDFIAQAEALAAAVRSAGGRAELRLLPRTLRDARGTYLGAPQHPQTEELRADLRRLAGPAGR